jgi:sulfite exporter TauE/SafE
LDLFIPMIGVGLVTSIHCVAMCGTMVCSYAIKGSAATTWWGRMLPHLAYHGPKILSYVAVGVLLGAIGSAFDVGPVRGYVTLFAGAFMLFLGVQMTGKFPALQRFTIRTPRFMKDALSRTRKKAQSQEGDGKAHLGTPITFGLLTGFMPCGPLQAAQLAAAGTGSVVGGATAMLGFGLGTMPLMLAFGTVSSLLGAKFKKRMMAIGAIIIIALGFVMLDRGSMLIGSPVTFQAAKGYFFGAPAGEYPDEFPTGDDGVVEVPLTIADIQFDPFVLTVPDGEPVRLIVDRQEDDVCSDELAIPKLGILEPLEPFGTTVIEIPPSEGGRYTMTCQMGMIPGAFQVGEPDIVSSGQMRPVMAVVALFGVFAYARNRREKLLATATLSTGDTEPVASPVEEAAAPALVLGYTPRQIMVALCVLGLSAVAGLASGGLFDLT